MSTDLEQKADIQLPVEAACLAPSGIERHCDWPGELELRSGWLMCQAYLTFFLLMGATPNFRFRNEARVLQFQP